MDQYHNCELQVLELNGPGGLGMSRGKLEKGHTVCFVSVALLFLKS